MPKGMKGMPNRLDVYKCEGCDIMFEALTDCECGRALKCGDDAVELVEANTTDAAGEKHVPVVEKTEKGFKVTVGSVAHPMEEDHYIQFIEIIADDRIYRAFLKPGQAPEAEFSICADKVTAREYCNLHGLWEA